MLISVHYIIMIKQDCFLQKINVNLEDIYSIKDENNEIYKFISQDSYNRLINSLNPKEQEVVSLKLLSNLTFKEIGSLVDWSMGK